MLAHLRFAFAGAGLAALTLALTLGVAQPPDKPKVNPAAKPDEKKDPPPTAKPTEPPPDVVRVGNPGETTLFMMVRTGPHLTPDNLKTTLQEGLSAARCTISGEPIIRPVSPAVFEEIESLTNQAAAAGAGGKPATGLRRMASREMLWEFRLDSPSQILKTLKVKYKSPDGKEYDKEYAPVSPANDGQLVLVAPGFYSFKPEPTDQPIAYEAEIISLGQPAQKMEGKWPSNDRYYVITMRNFRGDKDYLFHVLQDPLKVANPLDSIRLGSDLVFVFANLDALGADEDDDVIAGNNLILGAPSPRGRSVARGWILFPLTEAAMKEKLAEYRKITDSKELIVKVRENAIFALTPTEIGPDTPAKWLELGLRRDGRFRREVPIKDFAGLLAKYPTAWGLVVWEFENDLGMRSAIMMRLPGGQTMVREKEIRNWSNSLKEKVNGSK
jgi:hypothetical protein